MSHSFYRGSDCCAVVFDLTDRASWDNLDKWIKGFKEEVSEGFPFLLIGNKSDLTHERQVTETMVRVWREDYPEIIGYVESSAKSNENVEQIFESLIHEALRRTSRRGITPERGTVAVDRKMLTPHKDTEATKKKKKCC